jgi:hypothetical protein
LSRNGVVVLANATLEDVARYLDIGQGQIDEYLHPHPLEPYPADMLGYKEGGFGGCARRNTLPRRNGEERRR